MSEPEVAIAAQVFAQEYDGKAVLEPISGRMGVVTGFEDTRVLLTTCSGIRFRSPVGRLSPVEQLSVPTEHPGTR